MSANLQRFSDVLVIKLSTERAFRCCAHHDGRSSLSADIKGAKKTYNRLEIGQHEPNRIRLSCSLQHVGFGLFKDPYWMKNFTLWEVCVPMKSQFHLCNCGLAELLASAVFSLFLLVQSLDSPQLSMTYFLHCSYHLCAMLRTWSSTLSIDKQALSLRSITRLNINCSSNVV